MRRRSWFVPLRTTARGKMRQNGADLVYGPGRITTLAYRVHRMDAMLAFYSEALV